MVYHGDNEIVFFYQISEHRPCIYSMYFKSKKELYCDRFVDVNILVATRLIYSDL